MGKYSKKIMKLNSRLDTSFQKPHQVQIKIFERKKSDN